MSGKAFVIKLYYSIYEFSQEIKKSHNSRYEKKNFRLKKLRRLYKESKLDLDLLLQTELKFLTEEEKNDKCIIEIDINSFFDQAIQTKIDRDNKIDIINSDDAWSDPITLECSPSKYGDTKGKYKKASIEEGMSLFRWGNKYHKATVTEDCSLYFKKEKKGNKLKFIIKK